MSLFEGWGPAPAAWYPAARIWCGSPACWYLRIGPLLFSSPVAVTFELNDVDDEDTLMHGNLGECHVRQADKLSRQGRRLHIRMGITCARSLAEHIFGLLILRS